MASFDEELDSFVKKAMSKPERRVHFNDKVRVKTFERVTTIDEDFASVLAAGSFQTMASAESDRELERAWLASAQNDEEDAILADLIADGAPAPPALATSTDRDGDDRAVDADDAEDGEKPDDDDNELFDEGDGDDVEDARIKDEEDDEEASASASASSSESSEDVQLDGDGDDDDDSLSENTSDEFDSLDTTQRLQFSSSEDDDDDSDNDDDLAWMAERQRDDFESEKSPNAGAVKKRAAKSTEEKKQPRKRHRAREDDQRAQKETQSRRKIELKAKMATEQHLAIIKTYIKMAAVDCVLRMEHDQSDDRSAYTSFRTLVLDEAQKNADNEFAAALVDIDADIVGTIAVVKQSSPEALRLLIDFVSDATDLQVDAAGVPSTASRCDATQRPLALNELICARATYRGGMVRSLVLQSALKNFIMHLWTLVNFYDITAQLVSQSINRLANRNKGMTTAEVLAAIEADEAFAVRMQKKLSDAHGSMLWQAKQLSKK